jgi:hypothetical protein
MNSLWEDTIFLGMNNDFQINGVAPLSYNDIVFYVAGMLGVLISAVPGNSFGWFSE